MKDKNVTLKQICAIFIALLPPIKIIATPSLLAERCAEKLWFPPIILCVLDLILIFLILKASKKHDYKNAFEILCETYSTTFAKVIFFIWGTFFLSKSLIPLLEHKRLIESNFYETLQKAPVFFPFFAVCLYVAAKGVKSIGQVCQILAPVTLVSLILVLYLSISPGDYKTLLPLFNINVKNGAISALNVCLWFNDAIYLIFFTTAFKGEKHLYTKLAVCYCIPFVLTIAVYVAFYAIFSSIASTQTHAVSSMSIFSLTLVNIGRFDHLAVFLLSLCSVVAIALPVSCSVKCYCVCFNVKKRIFIALAVVAILLSLTLAFENRYREVIDFYFSYLSPFVFACGYGLPLLLLGKKRGEKNALQKV